MRSIIPNIKTVNHGTFYKHKDSQVITNHLWFLVFKINST